MSLVPVDDEGYPLKAYPFVTVYEKFVDGLVFRYAKYKNEAYIVIKDSAAQLKLANPTSSANKFHTRFKSRLPNSFKKFKAMTRGGPQNMLFGDLTAINVFCSRTRNVEAAANYITKLTQFQKWFYATQAKEQALVEAKLKGDIKFLSSEIKFLHQERSIDRRNITKLAQAVKQLQTQSDVKIDSEQVDEIFDLVTTKLTVLVAEKEGLKEPNSSIYKKCWLAFNKNFNIATYRNLPSSQFEDAKEYLLYLIEKISQEID